MARTGKDPLWTGSDPNSRYELAKPVEKTSGQKISERRAQAGLTAQDFEDYTGIKKSELLAMEAGLLDMSDAMAEALSQALGMSLTELKRITSCS